MVWFDALCLSSFSLRKIAHPCGNNNMMQIQANSRFFNYEMFTCIIHTASMLTIGIFSMVLLLVHFDNEVERGGEGVSRHGFLIHHRRKKSHHKFILEWKIRNKIPSFGFRYESCFGQRTLITRFLYFFIQKKNIV